MTHAPSLCLLAPETEFEAAPKVTLSDLCHALAQHHALLFVGSTENCKAFAHHANIQCMDISCTDDNQLVDAIQQFAPRVTHAFGQEAWMQLRRVQQRLYSASAFSPDYREAVPADVQFADLLLMRESSTADHPNLMQFPAASTERIGECLSAIYYQIVVAPLAGFQPLHWFHYRVIAKGANRVCVYAEENSGQCIKFLTARGAAAVTNPNQQEWRAYQRWQQRSDSQFNDFFSPCVGMETTAHGEVLRCELVCNGDGSLARPIYHYFSHPAPFSQKALHNALNQFEQYVHANRLPLFDLNAGNLLVVTDSTASPRLVCADAKSLDARKELLPLSRWFEWARRRKVSRRFQRLHQRIDQRWLDTEEKTP